MRIIADDFTFTTNDWGYKRLYGTGGGCTQEYGDQGKLRMNLQGTSFHFHPAVNYLHIPHTYTCCKSSKNRPQCSAHCSSRH